MRRKTSGLKTAIYITVVTLLAISNANASTFYVNGKEVTKGQALVAALTDKNAKVVKSDEMVANIDKGTLKIKPKN